MTETADDRQKALQIEVQRLLGRCLLKLQQYERLLKAILTHSHVTAKIVRSGGGLEVQLQKTDTALKTLGQLVGAFTGGHMFASEAAEPDGWPITDDADFSLHLRTEMTDADLARTVQDLRDLVTLRNTLVHHFFDHHDITTAAGCQQAVDALRAAGNLVDAHLLRLQDWAGTLGSARQAMTDALASGPVREWLVQGPPKRVRRKVKGKKQAGADQTDRPGQAPRRPGGIDGK